MDSNAVSYRFARLISAVLILVLCALPSFGQATERIILIGDSWTGIMWGERSIQAALNSAGLSDYVEVGAATAIGGTTAAQWARPTGDVENPASLELITQELQAHPTVDIVHLSIGGNDLLGAGDLSQPAVLEALIAQIIADTETVVLHILAERPTARILLAEYDYLPSATPESNAGQALIAQARLDQTLAIDGFYFLNNLGLMHNVFGFPPNFGPGEVPFPGVQPDYTPLLGGDPDLGSDPATFRDAIHLSTAGYLAVSDNAVNQFYAAWLTDRGIEAPASVLQRLVGGRLELTITGAVDLALPIQWFLDGNPLSDDGRITGSSTRTLRIDPLVSEDAGNYTATYDNVSKASDTFGPIALIIIEGSLSALSTTGLAVLLLLLAALALTSLARRRT